MATKVFAMCENASDQGHNTTMTYTQESKDALEAALVEQRRAKKSGDAAAELMWAGVAQDKQCE